MLDPQFQWVQQRGGLGLRYRSTGKQKSDCPFLQYRSAGKRRKVTVPFNNAASGLTGGCFWSARESGPTAAPSRRSRKRWDALRWTGGDFPVGRSQRKQPVQGPGTVAHLRWLLVSERRFEFPTDTRTGLVHPAGHLLADTSLQRYATGRVSERSQHGVSMKVDLHGQIGRNTPGPIPVRLRPMEGNPKRRTASSTRGTRIHARHLFPEKVG